MSWEALSALGSLASAVIVLVAAIAAVLQLRPLRLANQLQTYMQLAMAPRLWQRLAPVAAVIRERSASPIWINFEYLVYRGAQQRLLEKFFKRYPDEFANATDVQKYRSLALSRITESPGSKP